MSKVIKAPIVRKASSVSDWQDIVKRYEIEQSNIVVDKVIKISKEKFEALSQDFFAYRDYITENLDSMYYDSETKTWHCLAVISDDSYLSILIQSEGYDYARYTSVISKADYIKEIGIMTKPKVEYDGKSPQCSIGYLLKACSQALRKERRITDFNDLRDKVLSSKGYEDAYVYMKEYVDLVDISK